MVAPLIENTSTRPKKITHEHKDLGTLIGWERGDDVIQFRGLPYADIPGRFRQSVLRAALPQQPYDATQPGPTCPHPPQDYWKYWEAKLPIEFPELRRPQTNEFDCLNLSITTPSNIIVGDEKLPVFVFIHGGAFVGGSHAIQLHGRETFDPTGLVRHSVQLGKSIIAVAINYRVGPLGFLASKELSAFSKQHGEPAGNYGLHDQRQALEWLYHFIGGFGGDHDRITIQGTSAGGASCHFQTLFANRKFQRAILASGTCWGIGAVPENIAQHTFDRIYNVTKGDQTESSLEVISELNVEVLNTVIQYDVFNPLIDKVWIHNNALLPPDIGTSAPAEIMVGAALREDDIAALFLRDLATSEFRSNENAWEFISSIFASSGCMSAPEEFPFNNAALMQAYGFENLPKFDAMKPELGLAENCEAWSKLLGHVLFNFPTYLLAERLSRCLSASRVWLYHYEARNPYPASHSRDMAHHGVNDLLLFNIAEDQIPVEHLDAWKDAVNQTQRSWIEFTNGNSPWSPMSDGEVGPIFVFRDGQESCEHEDLTQGLGPTLAKQWALMRESCIQ